MVTVNYYSQSFFLSFLLDIWRVNMDKFGYIRGQRGPPGPRGKDAVPFYTWCPDAMLKMFRQSEKCTYYFNDVDSGILSNKEKRKRALRDQFGNNHALCLKNFQKPTQVGKFYCLPLKDTLYQIKDMETATAYQSICFIAFAFKVTTELSEEVTIFTNKSETRGVTISKSSLNILETDPLKLKYEYRDWNTVIIQYSNTENNDGKCFFVVNGRRGFFIPHKTDLRDEEVYIGGNSKGEKSANVMLLNFELYWKPFDAEQQLEPNDYLVPQEMIDLVCNDMDDRRLD